MIRPQRLPDTTERLVRGFRAMLQLVVIALCSGCILKDFGPLPDAEATGSAGQSGMSSQTNDGGRTTAGGTVGRGGSNSDGINTAAAAGNVTYGGANSDVSTGIAGSGGAKKDSGAAGGGQMSTGQPSAGQPSNSDPATCAVGAIRCNGNIREQSTADCRWIALLAADQCSGDKPVCTGAGLCASWRLLRSSLVNLSAASNSAYTLQRQSLTISIPMMCNSQWCVRGRMSQ